MRFRFAASASVVIAVAMGAGLVPGCSDDLGAPQCTIEEVPLAGTPLTLLSSARLDRPGPDMVLIGSDGQVVRWARLDADAQLGPEHEVAVPAHVGGPWFALAGSAAAGDRVVIAYITGPATASLVTPAALTVLTVSAADGAAVSEPLAIAEVPDPRVSPLRVSMASGRAGMQAGIAWATRGETTISALTVNGDGQPAGPVAALATVGDFDCLRFSSGKQDLTLGYVDLTGTPPAPAFVGFEISETGAAQPFFRLGLGREMPGCVELASTDTGYALAWHNPVGTYLGVYAPASRYWESNLVVGDVRIEGGPPTVGGVGWMGRDYALIFDRPTGAEAWRLDLRGRRKGGGLVFPSLRGRVGRLSTQPVGTVLHGTYADYASADPGNQSEGQRFLVTLSCP